MLLINRFTDSLFFSFDYLIKKGMITLSDAEGNTVASKAITNSNFEKISIKGFSGKYLIQVSYDNNTTKRIFYI